jgi:hypothetical protein
MVLTRLNGCGNIGERGRDMGWNKAGAHAGYAFSGGDGSSATPYSISTAADLAQLGANVNAGTSYSGVYFKMKDDNCAQRCE